MPDAELLQRLAQELDTTVAQLLGAQEVTEKDSDQVAEQLARINEQLVIKNRRAKRVWTVVAVVIGLLLILQVLQFASIRYYSANPHIESSVTTIESGEEETATEIMP